MAIIRKNWNTITPEIESFNRFPATFTEMLDDFFGSSVNTKGNSRSWRPEMNVSETNDQFEITVALPGINRDDIEISLEDHTLTISGERKWPEDSDRKHRLIESRFGTFSRSLPLPDTIDPDSVEAHFDNGVLYVTIKKQEDKVAKKIEVK